MIKKIQQKIKSVLGDKGFMKYFKNTSWLLAEKILRIVVGLFVGVWVARYLGPEQFGSFSYAQSFVGLFAIFATLGLDGIIVRELVKNENRRDELIGTAFWLKLFGAIVVLGLLALAVNFTSNSVYANVLIFIIASATIFQSFNVVDFYFQSKVLSRYIVYANVFSLLISSIVKILLILNEAPLMAFAIVIAFDSFVLACGFVYFYFKKTDFKVRNLKFKKNVAIGLLKDSWPLILSGAVLMMQARIDQVMIKEMRGNIEVGYYSVAMKLIEAVALIPMLLKNSLYPSIQSAKNVGKKMYQGRLLNFYRLNFVAFLLVGVPIFFFSEQMVVLLFGAEYQPAGILLAFLSIRIFFTNMGVSRSVYILNENLMKFSFITMILGTIINVGLNYAWIPNYGAKGAVIATIFSFFVTIFMIDLMYVKTRKNAMLQLKSIFTFYKLTLKK